MHVIRSVCFTGHRPEKLCRPYSEENTLIVQLKEKLDKEIRFAAQHGCRTFYAGMARGTDILAAELVLALKEELPGIELIAVEPCPQVFKEPWQSRAERICSRAQSILLQEMYTPDCYARRNRYLVDHAQLVIAVWDGRPRSGTAQTVEYARRQNRELHILRLFNGQVEREIVLPDDSQQNLFDLGSN